MAVILIFDSSNQFNRSFLQLKWFISTPMNRNSNWLCCYQFNWCFIFNITWFVSIFLTMGVILKFYSYNQFNRSFLQLKLFISTPMNWNSNWLCCYHFNWCFIFNNTWFVSIFLIMELILNFYWSDQFNRSFLQLKWFISTMKGNSNLRCCYEFNWCFIFNNTWLVSIFLTMEVILNFYCCDQFNRSFLQLKWFISTAMNRNSNLLYCFQLSWWYMLNNTWFVSIFLTMEVILNFYSSNQFNRSFLQLKWFISMTISINLNLLYCYQLSWWYILITPDFSSFLWQLGFINLLLI